MDASMIRLEGVVKRFGDVVALDGATLDVRRGEVLALLGPSGCGKTTLLRVVAGFERPEAGLVELAGAPVSGAGTWVPPERRRVGMVFQDYALFPHLTVRENVGFGLPRRARAGRVAELLSLVALEGLASRYPHELSGGQQQRVALARALAPSPEVILLDEPWSNVDSSMREVLRAEVTEIIRPLGVTVVLVTHDREEAFSLADRIALMREGSIVQVGTAEDLYFAPASRWAAEFVGAANVLVGRVERGLLRTAIGAFPVSSALESSALEATEVELLLRPELVGLRPDPTGAGEVIAREFRGHDVFYRVRIADVELVSQRPSNEVVPLGSRVALTLQEGRTAVLPAAS
jgi:iron(III) transport system ATP-binding protein